MSECKYDPIPSLAITWCRTHHTDEASCLRARIAGLELEGRRKENIIDSLSGVCQSYEAQFKDLESEVKRLLAEKAAREAYFSNQVGAHRDSVQCERDINAILRRELAALKAHPIMVRCGQCGHIEDVVQTPCEECTSRTLEDGPCPSCGGTGKRETK